MRVYSTTGWRFWLRVALPIAIGTAAALRACAPGVSAQTDDFTATYIIDQMDTYDPKLDYFTLKSRGGSFLVMLDRDLPAAAYLRRHDHERISLTLAAPKE